MADKVSPTLAKLIRARAQLIFDQPFFGALALRLRLVEDRCCKTVWVDGVSLGYNPAYVEKITDLELQAVLCHDVLHVANGHCWRRGDRDFEDWNDACDYAINPILVESDFQLPADAFLDPQFAGQCAEQIYDAVHRPKLPPPPAPESGPAAASDEDASSSDAGGSGGGDSDEEGEPDDDSSAPGDSGSEDDEDFESDGDEPTEDTAGSDDEADDPDGASVGPNPDPKDSEPRPRPAGEVRDAPKDVVPRELEADWKLAVDLAVKAAELHGKLPGHLKRLAEEVLKPTVDWRSALRQFVQQSWSVNDYSYRQPAARFLAHGIYMPRLVSETLPVLVIFIDTSGSIYGRLLSAFKAEVMAIIEELKPQDTYIVYCDAAVQRVDRWEEGSVIAFEPEGGGGTDFRPAFEWAEREGVSPTCAVFLTDLDGDWPAQAPDYPVLWATPPTKLSPDWGEHLEMRE